jgi:hypothetical protein
MADKKISQLTASTTPLAGTEVLPIVQSGVTKQVSVNNLTAGKAVSTLSISSTGAFTLNTGYSSANNKIYTDNTGTTGAALWFRKGRDVGSGPVDAVGLDCLNGAESGVVPAIIRANPLLINDTVGTNKFENGNLVVGTAGKGIDFSANTNAAGMTSELLNWYEEGTWTPTVSSSGGGTGTYSDQVGRYTRIGRQVTVTAYINWSAHTGSGSMRLAGLPFTSGSSGVATASIGYFNNIAFTAGAIPIIWLDANSTFAYVYEIPSGGGLNADIPLDTAGAIMYTLTYFV